MVRLPAEWETQQQVLFSFPRREGDWGASLEDASRDMIAAARAVHRVCPVTLIVGDQTHFAAYATDFPGRVLHLPTDDSWIRDSGPITVFNPGPQLLDWTFNGWGGKFSAERDNSLPRAIGANCYPDVVVRTVDYVLEGGSIESDGQGTIITTTRCLLSHGRNGFHSRSEAEEVLRAHLGARRVIWLDHGELIGDDTDAHIDTVARFLDPQSIAYVGPPPAEDEHHDDFTRMRAELRQKAGDYRLLELPFVPPVYSIADGHRLPASYANFLISNGSLFLPTYGKETDALALSLLRENCGYDIVPVDCRAFVEQHGALHCLTMHIPSW